MNRRGLSILLCTLCLALGSALFVSPSVARAQGDAPLRRYITGTVVSIGGRYGGRTGPFRLIVNRYSTTEEVQRLNSALQSGGEDEMLRVLSGMDAGRIQLGNGVGVAANAIIATPQPGGDLKVTVLYQRNIQFFERRYGTRSEDYRFGYAEIFLRNRGSSEGTLIPAARIRLRSGNTWEVEDFGAFPARLMGIRASTTGGRAR